MRIGRVGFAVGSALLAVIGASAEAIGASGLLGAEPAMATTGLRIGSAIGELALVTWRCHDFNETVWHVFWIDQVPVVGQAWALWLLLTTPGTEGMNSYGHPLPF